VRRWQHHLIYPRAKGYAFASNLVATLKEWDLLAKSPSLGRKYMFRKLNSGVITKGPMTRLGRGCSYTRGYSGTLLTDNYQLKSVQVWVYSTNTLVKMMFLRMYYICKRERSHFNHIVIRNLIFNYIRYALFTAMILIV
jgi:hypothetical protein